MSNCNDIDKVLKRHGTGQEERFITQLNPANFELNDFDVEDWLLFAYNFAKHVNYFETSDSNVPQGDWQDFFNCFDFPYADIFSRESEIKAYNIQKEQITKVLSSFKEAGELTPHLTLFVCFLQLLEQSKKRFNNITKRHLDFYYKNILKVDKRPATPDKVHVLFELAKKSIQTQVIENTELNAKQDLDGTPLIYKTDEELIPNQAKVTSLKTIYNDVNLKELKVSAAANTLDGIEEPLPEEAPYWLPFGYTSNENKFIELPDATVGFALASPLLLLKEGKRTVEITLNFASETPVTGHSLTDFIINDFEDFISIDGSGEKDWINTFTLIKDTDAITEMCTKVSNNNQLSLAFQLEKDSPALLNYSDEVLLEKYNTTFPVVRFKIDTSRTKGHDFFRALVNRTLNSIIIKVDVKDAKTVHIENDNGVLKAEKPFFPFTSQPIITSNFYIHYKEAFAKAWKNITIKFSWKNAPENFATWYEGYDESIDDNYFTTKKEILHKESWLYAYGGLEESTTQQLFKKPEGAEKHTGKCVIQINNDAYEVDKTGPVRLSLNKTFLHELFPKLFASSLIGNTTSTINLNSANVPVSLSTITTEGDIPNAPYTPIAENITFDYTAEETRTIATSSPEKSTKVKENFYNQERIKLFHIHPFGQSEEHEYLKEKKQKKGIIDVYDSTNIKTFLLPKYCDGGELFIGLIDAQVKQNVSLLVQVLEGSENPQVDSFEDQEEIQWAVLCDNKWKGLKDDIISNSTGKFLNSGIIKFTIPREATTENTRLPKGYIWIRAKMHRDYDAVCKVINIHAQAVLSTFEDRINELSHLNNGLPAETISKLITRIPQVKGVSQPYTSFDGIPEESDEKYYRRISERLRHKNRAITLWDYEHLILQKFPEIFKVKCLNHTDVPAENDTTKDSYIAAGYVTLIVVPDTINKNVFDIYQPRVSKGLINKIKGFIKQLNTLHVTANVINPRYEEVKVALEVQFFEGYDKIFYSKQLEADITKFLSPWAFDTNEDIVFGVDLHKSVLIDYMEKLTYVDYLQNVILKNGDGEDLKNVVVPSNPRSILVSAKTHDISTDLTPCKGKKPQIDLICQ